MPISGLFLSQLLNVFYLANNSDILREAQKWALAFFGLGVGYFLCTSIQGYGFGVVNSRMTSRVRRATFVSVLKSEISFFDDDSNSVGVLTSKLASDASLVKAAVSDRVQVAIMNIATIAAGLGVAFAASWKIALVTLATFPVIVLTGVMQARVMNGLAQTSGGDLAKANQTLAEAVASISTVAAFNMQESVSKVYAKQMQQALGKV